jgi:hypothetical protein
VFPFFIGLLEFMLIEVLGPDGLGLWVLILALIFGLMTWIAHLAMRRARLDGENDAFFSTLDPAKLRDFYPQIATVCGLTLAGVYLLISEDKGAIALLVLLATSIFLTWQFYLAALYWDRSVSADQTNA